MKLNTIYLQHILDEINFLMKETSSLSFEEFVESELYTRAFSRSLEIIGEAVKNLPDSFRESHPDIEWKKLAGMRDKIVHHYFGVDYELIWDVVTNKIPHLKDHINRVLNDN